jgi:hypothetical protein
MKNHRTAAALSGLVGLGLQLVAAPAARNVRILVEGEYDIEVERSRATFGFVTAF